jgi:hypothetical protein
VSPIVISRIAILLLLPGVICASAQTNIPSPANAAAPATNVSTLSSNEFRALTVRGEQIRAVCVQNRRYICGRILKILPDGLVVDSGYTRLLKPPLNHSWLVPGTAVVERDDHLVEGKEPDSVCVGLVFLTDLPRARRVKPKQYDYVVLLGYPAGQKTYTSVGTIQRTVRRFSAGLENAVRLNLQTELDQARASGGETK